MDKETKILTPLKNHQSIPPRGFKSSSNKLGGYAKHSEPSPKANILVRIFSEIILWIYILAKHRHVFEKKILEEN